MANIRIYGLEALAGLITGVILAAVFGFLSSLVGRLAEPTMGDLVGLLFGGWIGYVVGMPSGIAVAGARLGKPGVFFLALVGSVIGGVLALALAEPLRLNQSTAGLYIAFGVMPLLLSVMGYNLRLQRAAGASKR